ELVFGKDYIRVHCWFHVKKNIENRLKPIKFSRKNELLSDICVLQKSRSKIEFDSACTLFITKQGLISARFARARPRYARPWPMATWALRQSYRVGDPLLVPTILRHNNKIL